MTTNFCTKFLSKEKHQLCVTHLGMCPISHFFVSWFGNTQALIAILYNEKDQFWNGRGYNWSFLALRNANYFIKICPLCKENFSLVSNFHVWNFKQNSSNKMGLCKDYSSIDYSRDKVVWVTTKTFQPNNVYKRQSYNKT
jgi:hypothetical protein